MRIKHILGLFLVVLMIVLISGCAAPPQAPPAEEPTAPAEEAAPAVPEEMPEAAVEGVENAAEETTAEAEFSEAEQKQIDLLKPACGRGSIKSCLTLKSRFGIEMETEPKEAAAETGATE